ncbi:Cd(II)/Pb(II)-responsive transcriptional regulator [Hahella ganghwensis]|uniref:Cd(II)/Pb(II)-responsive transcriptional regulator n=1 Tax=Hahella ganghwensis TaxID=286420 RepID=UPI0003760DAF|nr:Cd(II)/Pb(II)-responsive transcriptional regulator [Hahella ganghwensis]
MRIGVLAKKAQCDVETVRYYERIGLLPAPARLESGYRDYRQNHLDALHFIRHCRALELSLKDIEVLLHYQSHPDLKCDEVNQSIDRHIDNIEQKIESLVALKSRLTTLRSRCDSDREAAECGILKDLDHPVLEGDCGCHGEDPSEQTIEKRSALPQRR